MKSRFSVLFFIACLLSSWPGTAETAQPAEAAAEFRSGVQAFKAGNLGAALEHFRKAEAAGYRSHALMYNLGVAYYKLMFYEESRRYFEQLEKDAKWRELARLNIGLVMLRQERAEEAIAIFEALADSAVNEKIRYLAKQQLLERADETLETGDDDGSGGQVSFAAGHDDNVVAFPEILQKNPSQGTDAFGELFAYGQAYAGGQRGDGFRFHGYAFARHYDDFDNFDATAVSLGVAREHTSGNWLFDYGIAFSQTAVDSNKLSTEARISFAATRRSGANRYSLGYSAGYHDAGIRYPQLEGMNHRFDARWRHDTGNWRWQTRYRLDVNKRDDFQEFGFYYFSYSPVKNSLALQADWRASERWTWTFGGEYERADHKRENVLIDADGFLRFAERETSTRRWQLRGEYAFAPDWRLFADWRRTDADDTFLLYTYERDLFRLGVEYGF